MSKLRNSVALCLGAASFAAAAQSPMPAFMAGCWSGEHADSRRSSYEVWVAPKAERMLGISQTVRPDRTEFEFLRVERAGGQVDYVAQPSGRPPTRFRMTDTSVTHAEFANPEHDFAANSLHTMLMCCVPSLGRQSSAPRRICFRKVVCETLTELMLSYVQLIRTRGSTIFTRGILA
jgi:hypothetical protein